MSLPAVVISEVASALGLVPLVWLAGQRARGKESGPHWSWLAAAFGISWLADSAALGIDPWIVSAVYPVSQAMLVGAVLLTRVDALQLLVVLGVAGIVGIAWEGVSGPDVLLRTVACGAIAGIAWPRSDLGRLRTALLVYFGVGLVVWWGYATIREWPSWGTAERLAPLLSRVGLAWAPWMVTALTPAWLGYLGYHVTRLVGVVLFCWAETDHRAPSRLTLVHPRRGTAHARGQ